MKHLCRIVSGAAFLLAAGTSVAVAATPNVLLVVCDDLNTHVSTSGYPHIRTPAFDELAAAGMTFGRAYCQYPVCGPSRASFLSGLYPQSTGVLDNRADIRQTRPGSISMPQSFKKAGYWTGSVGKVFHNTKIDPGEVAWNEVLRFDNDELPLVTPIRKAFETEHGPIDKGRAGRLWRKKYPTIATQTRGQQPGYGPSGLRDEQHKDGKNARQIVSWLENKVHGEKPFFMACGIQKPHVPFLAPDAYFEMYPRQSLQFSPAPADFWDQAPNIAMVKRYEGFGFKFGVENDQLRREYMQAYHACISFIDAQIGLIFEALKRTGHWDDTIIILTSDHGYQLGEHFMWGKVTLFEVCDRVPLVIRVPGMTESGSSNEELVELVDLFPTLAELCDVAAPDDLQGQSVVPMLRGSKSAGKDVAYTVVTRGDKLGKAIRTDRWRYTLWPVGEELYDLKNDSAEHRNLANSKEHAEIVKAMRAHVAQAESEALSAQRLTSAVAATSETYHVSPNGNDGNPGTQEQPFATLHAARDAARRTTGRPVTIYLHAGTHYLTKPLVLTSQDSGTAHARIVYKSMPGETAIISGGQRLQLDWKPYRNDIMQAKVPAGFTSDQLFVNGQRQQMARFPNYDPSAQYFQGYSAACTSPDRIKQWGDPAGGIVHAMHRSLWGDMHWRIRGKTNDGKLEMIGGWQNNRQMGAHKDFRFVENIFEELDTPGEWYLDEKENVLFFYPPENVDLRTAKIEAVRLAHLVEFRGTADNPVRHIDLEYLIFTHTTRTFMENKEPLLRSDWTTYRGGAIFFDGATDCAVRECLIDQVGSNAIFVNKYNRGIEITGCHIADAGANAVSFVGDPNALRSPLFEYHQTQTLDEMDKTPGPRSDDFPSKCLVEDCLIYRNGRVEKQTAGVNLCMAQSITIRHCSIYDCPRAGINVCDGAFGGHLIELNDVFDTVKETGDHGSFNSWGRDRFWHPNRDQTADWLKEHPEMPKWDCQQTIVIRNNRWRCDHGWDIHLDDGSSNYELYNNLCLAGGIKLREGYFRKVTNNIMVDYTFCPHVWYPDCHTTLMRNIIWSDEYAPAGMPKTDQGATIDYNLVHQPGAESRPAENLAKFGGDQHSIVADARFLDAAAGDYRVQDGSPALALGWENFAMDQFGVQNPELKKLAKTPPLPGTLEAAGIRSGGWGRTYSSPKTAQWLGAKIKNIDDEGEKSAVGLGDKRGVLIVSVPDSSKAARLGLKEHDVVRAVNDQEIKDLTTLASAYKKQSRTEKITFGLWRDQAEFELEVTPSLPSR